MSAPEVLVVDDDRLTRLLAREALEGAGLRVREAGDGQEALENAQETAPDLVLLDLNMPHVDGFEALSRLRSSASLLHVPVLVLTARDDPDSVQRAYDLGATDFLAKPIHFQLLPHRVRYVLRAQEAITALRESGRRLERSQRMARVADWELDIRTGRLRFSRLFGEIFGQELDPSPGPNSLLVRVHPDDRARVEFELGLLRTEQKPFSEDHRLLGRDGEVIEVHHEAKLVGRSQISGTVQDISARKAAERRVGQLAFTDALTGLPNRAFLAEHLSYALARAERSGRQVALLCLDLDRFKRINDTLGHHAGDELLQAAAARLRACVRRSDAVVRPTSLEGARSGGPSVSRFGGDEFLVVLPDVEDPREPALLAERIVAALLEPYVVSGREVVSAPSLGIALSEPGMDSSALLSQADAAMYEAKGRGGGGFCFHSQEMTERVRQRLLLENSLRRGLAEDQVGCVFQPCVDLATGAVRSVEALARWTQPGHGTRMPAEFIPVAEEAGLIVPLGERVLAEACRAAARWAEAGFADVVVSVNVSARQLQADGFHAQVLGALANAGLAPDRLELELTESVLLLPEPALALQRLRAEGVRVALDDFGTGFSSLRYLKDLPADAVKIDQSFVAGLPGDGASVAIASAVIQLMSQLGLDVVAEGVETEAQHRFLRDQGCDSVQGYLVARPMPVEQLLVWLSERPSPA